MRGRGAVARLDHLDLLVVVEEAEDLHPQRHLGVLQHAPCLLRGEPFHEFRGSRRVVQRRAEFPESRCVILGEHLAKLGQVERVRHAVIL